MSAASINDLQAVSRRVRQFGFFFSQFAAPSEIRIEQTNIIDYDGDLFSIRFAQGLQLKNIANLRRHVIESLCDRNSDQAAKRAEKKPPTIGAPESKSF